MDADRESSVRSDVERVGVPLSSAATPREHLPGASELPLQDDGARDTTLRADGAPGTVRDRLPLRDLALDDSRGMRPRDLTRPSEATLSAAIGARGPRPPRDLVLQGPPGARLRDLEMPPPIPPDLLPKHWWNAPDYDGEPLPDSTLRFWVQRVVDKVELEGGLAVRKGWSHRDGATLCHLDYVTPETPKGRILLIGGWDSSDEPHLIDGWKPDAFATEKEISQGWTHTTNEVWKTDNEGQTWELLLPHDDLHDDTTFPPRRFPRVHTPAWTRCNDGFFYLIGGDNYVPHAQVWRTSLTGDGKRWQYMGVISGPDVHWGERILSIAGSLNGVIYVMGGQLTTSSITARNDVYYTADQCKSWHPVPWNPIFKLWEPRGMVSGMPVIRDRETGVEWLYLVGGGIFDQTNPPDTFFDSVWKFNGARWLMVRPTSEPGDPKGWPTGMNLPPGQPKTCGRKYLTVVLTPPGPDWLDGLIWVITGSVLGGNTKKLVISKDTGKTWEEAPVEADWAASHADGAMEYKGGIMRASGNAFDRSTYRISYVGLGEYLKTRLPGVSSVTPWMGKPGAGKDDIVVLTGTGFSTVRAVYVDPSTVNVTYAKFKPPTTDDTLEVVIPEVKLRDENGRLPYYFFIVVVNAYGSSLYTQGTFHYVP